MDCCFLCGLEIGSETDSFALFSNYGEMVDIIHKDCYRASFEKSSNKQKVINFKLLANNEEVT